MPVLALESRASGCYGHLDRPVNDGWWCGASGVTSEPQLNYNPRYALRTSGLVLMSAAAPCIRTRPVCRM
jgi:hypothetical protein